MTELNEKGKLGRKIVERMIARETEYAALVAAYEAACKTASEEYERALRSYAIEGEQLIGELNTLCSPKAVRKTAEEQAVQAGPPKGRLTHLPMVARPASRKHKHWTSTEKEQLKDRLKRLLIGSPGLSSSALANLVHVHPSCCAPLLRAMERNDVLRQVTVDVRLGKVTRKVKGYALPLQVVEQAKKVA